jgi:hypothetical protein
MAAKCHRVVWGRRTTACTSVFQTTLSPRGNSPELVNTTVEWKFDGFYGEYRWRRHVFAPLPNQITPTRMFHSCFYLNIVKGKGSQQIFYIFERSLHKSTPPDGTAFRPHSLSSPRGGKICQKILPPFRKNRVLLCNQ